MLKRMRRTYTRERFLDRVALIREHVPDCAHHHRRHRRLPGGDRGGLRRDARGRRGGRLRRRLHVHLLAPPRHRGGRLRRASSSRTRSASSAWSASSRSSSGAPASARSASSGARSTCSWRAPRAPTPARLRGRTRHNKVVNFSGLAAPGEIVPVEITAATSQTLRARSRCSPARSPERRGQGPGAQARRPTGSRSRSSCACPGRPSGRSPCRCRTAGCRRARWCRGRRTSRSRRRP